MEELAPSPDRALAQIAARNHGVVLATDAAEVGISPAGLTRRLAKGTLKRLHEGVYASTAAASSPRQTLLASCRWGGPGTAASHRAAAHLWQLDGFDQLILEISGPRRLTSDAVISHRTAPIPTQDLHEIDRIPVTRIERTLVDLAAVVNSDVLEDALDSALRRRLTTIHRLHLRVRAESRRHGVRALRSLLAERDDRGLPSASSFETRLNRLFLSAGLPASREFVIWDGGEFVARVDFCFPETKLIIEADGYRWHSSRRAWQRDRERRNQLTALGWQVIQLTWEDLTRRPHRTIERVRALIQPRLPIG